MASATSPISSNSAANSAQSSASALGASAPSEEMFLQLLVAQLQNQDPLNPTDSTQFVSQLAQFSELEQVMAIRGDIENYAASSQAAQSATQSTTQDTANTNTQTQNTQQTKS